MSTFGSEEEFPVHSSYVFWISRLASVMQEKFNQKLRDQEVTWPQWMVLNVLNQDIARTPATIADNLGIDRSAVTRLLDRLETKSLVVRHHDKLDRRSVTIALTEAGKELMAELNQAAKEHQSHFLSGLHNTEFRALKGNIQKMLKAGGVDSSRYWRQHL